MSVIRALVGGVLLLAASTAWAGNDTPVVIQTVPPQGLSTSTFNLHTNQGSSCTAPSVGPCGSCSVSCPTGQAAYCKAGVEAGKQSGASCLQPPECKCQ